MITTTAIKDWLKTVISSPSWTTGKLDQTKEKTICVYGGRGVQLARIVVGGGEDSHYTRQIQIIVRWGQSSSAAEGKAVEVYEKIKNESVILEGKRVWVRATQEEPVSLGTDDKGIHEYSIIARLTCER